MCLLAFVANCIEHFSGFSSLINMIINHKHLLFLTILFLFFAGFVFGSTHRLMIGNFSASEADSGLPEGWEQFKFNKIERHTRYRLVTDDNTVVLKAESDAAASGLIRRIRIETGNYKFISWRWKISNILKNVDTSKKEGDDYPARLFVNFEYDPAKLSLIERVKYQTARLIYGEYPPLCAISYVWGSKNPKGTVVPGVYSERAVSIVVESGESRLNQWIEVTRNIQKDYRAVFKTDPPPISGIAIMTDTDNTGESAVAYYGDIVLKKSRELY